MHSLNNEKMRKIIMEHYSRPKNKGFIKTNKAFYFERTLNSCDDSIKMQLVIEDGVVVSAKFEGRGCTITISSTDIICEMIKGMKINDIMILIINFENMLFHKIYNFELLDKLNVFKNISKQSNRIKCATIITTPLKEAINNEFK